VCARSTTKNSRATTTENKGTAIPATPQPEKLPKKALNSKTAGTS